MIEQITVKQKDRHKLDSNKQIDMPEKKIKNKSP